jgi:hypothetical protein
MTYLIAASIPEAGKAAGKSDPADYGSKRGSQEPLAATEGQTMLPPLATAPANGETHWPWGTHPAPTLHKHYCDGTSRIHGAAVF